MRRIQFSFGITCLFLMHLTLVLGQTTKFDEYPPHIIYRMQMVDSVTRLSKQSLHNLAMYFIRQDSLAANSLHEDGFYVSLAAFYQRPADELRGIISDLEFNDYTVRMRTKHTSRLREIVLYRDKINLKQSEVRGLLLCSDRVEMRIGQKDFQQLKQEYHWADSIIGQEGLRLFYSTKYKDKIYRTVKTWYAGMKKYNLIDVPYDSVSVCADLLGFENERLSYYEYWKNMDNITRYKEAVEMDLFKKPASLRRLEVYRKLPFWSMIRDIFDNKERIKLTSAQTDSLLGVPERFEKLKEEKRKRKERFRQRGLEYLLIKEVLTSQQIKLVLKEIYRDEVSSNVKEDVEILKSYGQLQGKDVGAISKELFDYQLDLKVANVLVGLEKSRENVFERYDLENSKPILVQKLEEIRKQEKKKKKVQF